MTGQERLGQTEARKENGVQERARGGEKMNKFMGHNMKRKMEGSGEEEGAWSHQRKIFIVRTVRHTQKHWEDSIKYHMQ